MKKPIKKIAQISPNGDLIQIWDSGNSIEKSLGLSRGLIIKAAKNNYSFSNGYYWKFLDFGKLDELGFLNFKDSLIIDDEVSYRKCFFVLEDLTLDKLGYKPSYIKKHSNLDIWVLCPSCASIRVTKKSWYKPGALCKPCSDKNHASLNSKLLKKIHLNKNHKTLVELGEIYQIRNDGCLINKWDSIFEASEDLNLSTSLIHKKCKKVIKYKNFDIGYYLSCNKDSNVDIEGFVKYCNSIYIGKKSLTKYYDYILRDLTIEKEGFDPFTCSTYKKCKIYIKCWNCNSTKKVLFSEYVRKTHNGSKLCKTCWLEKVKIKNSSRRKYSSKKEEYREKSRLRRKKFLYKIESSLRGRLHAALKKKNYSIVGKLRHLPYSKEELKSHLRNELEKGCCICKKRISIKDRKGKNKWHIAHIKPLCWAKTAEDVFKMFDLHNLSAAHKKCNLQLGGKLVPGYEENL